MVRVAEALVITLLLPSPPGPPLSRTSTVATQGPAQVLRGIWVETEYILFSPELNAILLDAMSDFCPQLDIAQTTTVYLCFCEEQLLMLPPMAIPVPDATVSVPVQMLALTRAQP